MHGKLASAALVVTSLLGAPAFAQTTPSPTSTPSQTPSGQSPATPPAASTVILPAPGMSGPLTLNPDPINIDLGPAGKTYITGVFTGLGLWQDNRLPGDQNGHVDVSNGQFILQK